MRVANHTCLSKNNLFLTLPAHAIVQVTIVFVIDLGLIHVVSDRRSFK
jgi:hypothetical protein